MNDCDIPRWQQLKSTLENLSFDVFVATYSSDPNGICLDARTPEEFHEGHLPGAININYLSDKLVENLERLDPSKTYYVCCRSGRRGLRVCVLLKNMGYSVFNLDEGLKSALSEGVI